MITAFLIAVLLLGSTNSTEEAIWKLYTEGDLDQIQALLPGLDASSPTSMFFKAVFEPDGAIAKLLYEHIIEKHPTSKAAPYSAERLWAFHIESRNPTAAGKVLDLLRLNYPDFKGIIDRSLLPPDRSIKGTDSPSGPSEVRQWTVQVGAFRLRKGAETTMKQISKFGRAYCLDSKNAKGPITLVRVGPFSSRPEAQATSDKINIATGLKTVVIETTD